MSADPPEGFAPHFRKSPVMSIRVVHRLTCAVLIVASLVLAPALAQQPQPAPLDNAARAQRLDELFARLKATKIEEDGDDIVAEIWRLWLQSGNAEIDAAMQQASLLMGLAPASAMPILDDIVKRLPDWAEGWNKRATALYLIGEHDRSLADIDRVLALEPRHFGALAGIGLIRMDKGENRAALAAFRRALAVNPFLKERLGLIPALEKEIGEKAL
jgi:tetratricopeptide (TPR) repeat protein